MTTPKVGVTHNSIVIDAPLPLVWDISNDLCRWTELFDEYQKVEILERRGETVRFRLTMHPDENGTVWSWVSERTPDPSTFTVDARRVEPGPFEYMRILWSYRTVEGGTEMSWTQWFHMREDAPVDDAAMTDRINTNTPIQMHRFKAAIEAVAALV
jgi:aromatase